MPNRAHRSPSSLASWGDGDDNDDEAVWPGIADAIRASLEDSGLASTSAPPAIPSAHLTPPNEIASSSTLVPRRTSEDRRGEGPNPFAMSDLRTALEPPPEFQPRRSILRNTLPAGASSSTHQTAPASLSTFAYATPIAPQPRPHDSWYSHLQPNTPVYQMLPTPSPSHPPSAPYLGANLSWPETPSSIAFPMTLNTTEVDEGWSTVDPAYDHNASVLFPTTREAYPPMYSAAAPIDATGLPLYPSQRSATDEAPAIRPRRHSTPRAVQPRFMGRDIVTGQPIFHTVDLTTEQTLVHTQVDNPDEWRQVYAKKVVCENVCAQCQQSRLIPSRFPIKWPQPDSIRRTQLDPGQVLATPPTDIEQSLVAECMICEKIHCRGCWNGEYRKPSDPFPAGCIRTDSCIMRRVIATFEALRSFDEHYLRFCTGETRTVPGLVSTSKAGRYLALQINPENNVRAVISTGLAAFVYTLSIIEYYLVRTAMNAHDGYVDVPEAYARMLEFSFIPRMIDELFSEPYRRRDVRETYATTYRHVLRFLDGYNDLFPGYVNAQRWDFTLSCGIGSYLRGEGEIDWRASGTPCAPSFFETIQAFWAPGEPIPQDITSSYNTLTS